MREITAESVICEIKGELQALPARQVIIALGAEADDRLASSLRDGGVSVHQIGDCRGVAYIDGAILSAREAVEQITDPAGAA